MAFYCVNWAKLDFFPQIFFSLWFQVRFEINRNLHETQKAEGSSGQGPEGWQKRQGLPEPASPAGSVWWLERHLGPWLLQPHAAPPLFPSVLCRLEVTMPGRFSHNFDAFFLIVHFEMEFVFLTFYEAQNHYCFLFSVEKWVASFLQFHDCFSASFSLSCSASIPGKVTLPGPFHVQYYSRDTCCHPLLTLQRSDPTQPRSGWRPLLGRVVAGGHWQLVFSKNRK